MLARNHFQQLLWNEVSKLVLLVIYLKYRWNFQPDRFAYRRAAEHCQRLLLWRGNNQVANRANPRACLTSHLWYYKWKVCESFYFQIQLALSDFFNHSMHNWFFVAFAFQHVHRVPNFCRYSKQYISSVLTGCCQTRLKPSTWIYEMVEGRISFKHGESALPLRVVKCDLLYHSISYQSLDLQLCVMQRAISE